MTVNSEPMTGTEPTPSAEPANEAAKAIAAERGSTAPLRQNFTTESVVPHALESLLLPSAQCAGIPVNR